MTVHIIKRKPEFPSAAEPNSLDLGIVNRSNATES